MNRALSHQVFSILLVVAVSLLYAASSYKLPESKKQPANENLLHVLLNERTSPDDNSEHLEGDMVYSREFTVNEWSEGKVHYVFDKSIDVQTANFICQAMEEIEKRSCIRFLKREEENHYLSFFKGAGCWSTVGRAVGKQMLSIGYGCESKEAVMVELMHALGFGHENNRPDRNEFITVIFDNAVEGHQRSFKISDIGDTSLPYDYESLMHYGAYAYSANEKKTILRRDGGVALGRRRGLSVLDIKRINQRYLCKKVDGGFGSWNYWSGCSTSCGVGVQTRSRVCDSPYPINGGSDCVGASKQNRKCTIRTCSVDCDFDDNICGWNNFHINDQFDWDRKSGSTASLGTGPSADHTKGDSTGYYMMIESSSPRSPGDAAKLQSQFIQVTPNPHCFKFWYHMKGSSMGRIDIDIQTESSVVPVWTLSGDQGSDWNHGSFVIPKLPGKKYKVVISGVVGTGYLGDAAIDDISFVDGSCPLTPAQAVPKKG